MFDKIKRHGMKVVDLGTGEGPLPHIIGDQGYDVTGVDNMRVDHPFKTSLVQMVLRDAIEFLYEIEDESVDVFTDSCSVTHFDFGGGQNPGWKSVFSGVYQKLKPGGYFLSFSSPRLYHAIAMACDIAGFEIRDMINWTYTQTMPKGMSVTHLINKMDISEEEKSSLVEEYKDFKTPQIKSCFEPICVAMKPTGKLTFIKNELNFKTGLIDFSQKVGIDKDRVPANIITTEEYNETYDKNFLIAKPNKKEKGEHNSHITVKPIQLIEHLIKIFSKKNSLVVDPFLGSGTTALACKNTDRNCVGIEINPEYYEISRTRCEL